MISIERKRTERSQKPFLLMLLDCGSRNGSKKNGKALEDVVAALLASTRETDITGWYEEGMEIGVMFTDLVFDDKSTILSTMLTRISTTLRNHVPFEQFSQISISFHFFPGRLGSRKLWATQQSDLVPRSGPSSQQSALAGGHKTIDRYCWKHISLDRFLPDIVIGRCGDQIDIEGTSVL